MLKRSLFLFLLFPYLIHAQYSINGKINSDDIYSWILLYKIENGEQVYVDKSSVEDGVFNFSIPESVDPGIYRAFYQIEHKLFVEFIYNKENINFSFNPSNPTDSIAFVNSDENTIYQNYYKTISSKQKKLDSLQVAYFTSNAPKLDKQIRKSYQKKLKIVTLSQLDFEKRSEGKIVNHFIKASKQYNAEHPIKNPENYLQEVKTHFYDYIDFNDPVLLNSTYITEKIKDHIFYLNQSKDPNTLNQLQKESIAMSMSKIESNTSFNKTVQENILKQYAEDQNVKMVNFLIEEYYSKLPLGYQDQAFKYEILSSVKTAIGKESPNIIWLENGVPKDLYGLTGFDVYFVVFFSSACPHCQNEMPLLHELVKNYSNIKVIAVGLEDEKTGWENMVKNLNGFTHILDLKKWDSQRAIDYGVNSLPSFFILDQNKKIIAKPETVEEIKSMFETK